MKARDIQAGKTYRGARGWERKVVRIYTDALPFGGEEKVVIYEVTKRTPGPRSMLPEWQRDCTLVAFARWAKREVR